MRDIRFQDRGRAMTDVQRRERSAPASPPTAAGGRAQDERAAHVHLDALLDEALAATFPASDPIALPAPPA
jgi:hypothetical protein